MERRTVALALAAGAAGLVLPRARTQPAGAPLPQSQLDVRTTRSSTRQVVATRAAAPTA